MINETPTCRRFLFTQQRVLRTQGTANVWALSIRTARESMCPQAKGASLSGFHPTRSISCLRLLPQSVLEPPSGVSILGSALLETADDGDRPFANDLSRESP
ncbi:hypothetical protein BaRGS_00012389 [Batillaria attramentaria]|uniref:Uncharacterized protein n=1 Tax=Batillaria attramentaria TaxID=370345 RepID=A0ABD0LBX8_9CAEN